MSRLDPDKEPATFQDVAAYFSEEEWKLLHKWQQELYKNVMKEIHQALISLGPLIATSVFSLRAKENGVLCFMDNHSSENQPSSKYIGSQYIIATTWGVIRPGVPLHRKFVGDTAANVDVFSTINREENQYLRNPEQMERKVNNACRNTDKKDISYIVSIGIKEEENGYPDLHQGFERRGCISNPAASKTLPLEMQHCTSLPTGFPSLSAEPSVSAVDHIGAGARKCTTVVNSGVNKSLNCTEQQQQACSWDTSYSNSEYGSNISQKSGNHHRHHSGSREYARTTYSYNFNTKSNLVKYPGTKRKQKPQSRTESRQSSHESTTMGLTQKLPTGQVFICGECGNCLNESRNVTAHQQKLNGVQHTCSACVQRSSLSTNLNKVHKKRIGERPYICRQCGNSFKTSQALMRHQLIHTGERPYMCSECGKSFRQSATLVKHKRIHIGESPYICGDCGKRFRQSSTLMKHRQLHARSKQ